MIVVFPTTGTQVEMLKTASGMVSIRPLSVPLDRDKDNIAGLVMLFNSGGIEIPDIVKDAVVAVPGGQMQQSVPTQPSQPGQGVPQLVTAEEFMQVKQQVQQLSAIIEKMTAQAQQQQPAPQQPAQQDASQPQAQPKPKKPKATPQPAAQPLVQPAQQPVAQPAAQPAPKMARGLV